MTEQRRTRFARLYRDGSMGICPATFDFVAARKELVEGSDDPNVELLEVEITVIRSHGTPKLKTVKELSVSCPTCGETIYVEDFP